MLEIGVYPLFHLAGACARLVSRLGSHNGDYPCLGASRPNGKLRSRAQDSSLGLGQPLDSYAKERSAVHKFLAIICPVFLFPVACLASVGPALGLRWPRPPRFFPVLMRREVFLCPEISHMPMCIKCKQRTANPRPRLETKLIPRIEISIFASSANKPIPAEKNLHRGLQRLFFG